MIISFICGFIILGGAFSFFGSYCIVSEILRKYSATDEKVIGIFFGLILLAVSFLCLGGIFHLLQWV